jgi:lipopolysaccharide/colanic/teichoic acid biosynthesis glycosyltransferase
LIAAAILLTSRGPVFYREERIGRDGQLFRIWKFRSMRQNAPRQVHIAGAQSGGTVLQWRMRKHLRDPRITAIGGFLRRWSLDEVPQLLNVLRGEMSFIGPRPIVEAEVVLYGDLLHFYLAAIPGLSGLWQVSGRSNLDYGKRAKLDSAYIRSWSLRADLSIFFRTIPAVLSRTGAR